MDPSLQGLYRHQPSPLCQTHPRKLAPHHWGLQGSVCCNRIVDSSPGALRASGFLGTLGSDLFLCGCAEQDMHSRIRKRNVTKAARPTQKAMTMESAGTAGDSVILHGRNKTQQDDLPSLLQRASILSQKHSFDGFQGHRQLRKNAL